MAKNAGKLARRYAKAFLSIVGEGQGANGQTAAQDAAAALMSFSNVWESDDDLPLYFLNPMVPVNDRRDVLEKVAQEAGLPEMAVTFLTALIERDRLGALPEIALAFSEIADEAAGAIKVELITARPIDDAERVELEQMVAQLTDGTPEFNWLVDEDLIGGVEIRFGGKVIDGSIRGRLQRIERSLVS